MLSIPKENERSGGSVAILAQNAKILACWNMDLSDFRKKNDFEENL